LLSDKDDDYIRKVGKKQRDREACVWGESQCEKRRFAQKKTSGNPSFLMFSGGEKTLAEVISAGRMKKLKFF